MFQNWTENWLRQRCVVSVIKKIFVGEYWVFFKGKTLGHGRDSLQTRHRKWFGAVRGDGTAWSTNPRESGGGAGPYFYHKHPPPRHLGRLPKRLGERERTHTSRRARASTPPSPDARAMHGPVRAPCRWGKSKGHGALNGVAGFCDYPPTQERQGTPPGGGWPRSWPPPPLPPRVVGCPRPPRRALGCATSASTF